MKKQSALKVLLTRPAKQAKEWESAFVAAGIHTVSLPMLAIQTLESEQDQMLAAETLLNVAQWDAVIFVSSNAVNYLAEMVKASPLFWPSGTPCFAIGPSTHKAIVANGWLVDASASMGHNSAVKDSESLLALPELSAVSDRNIAIVRGKGGRELIHQTLAARGATVTTIEVYQRCCPRYQQGVLQQALLASLQEGSATPAMIDAVVFASGDTVKNFCDLAEQDCVMDVAMNIPVVVPSGRVASIATQCGFNYVHVAAGSSVGDYVSLLAKNAGALDAPVNIIDSQN